MLEPQELGREAHLRTVLKPTGFVLFPNAHIALCVSRYFICKYSPK